MFVLVQDVDADINKIAGVGSPQSIIVTIGTLKNPREVYIIAEQLVIANISPHSCAAALLSAFYVMNMQFPNGLSNFYTVLEILLLNQCPKGIPIVVSQVISLYMYSEHCRCYVLNLHIATVVL